MVDLGPEKEDRKFPAEEHGVWKPRVEEALGASGPVGRSGWLQGRDVLGRTWDLLVTEVLRSQVRECR